MRRLLKLAQQKCPKCEKGDVFINSGNIFLLRIPKMHTHCPNCRHKFEIEPGYFFGAMYASYGLVILEGILLYFICDLIGIAYQIPIIAMIALFTFHNYRYARMIWMYVFTPKDYTIKNGNPIKTNYAQKKG